MNDQNAVVPFQFNDQQVRTVVRDGAPWFVAKDVCDVLEIANTRDAVANLDDDEKLVSVIPTSAQNREMNIISEPGLYRLVLRSDKPQAEPFMDWVTEEVLPSIRKTGSYSLYETQGSALDAMAEQLVQMVAPAVVEQAKNAINVL